MLPSSVYVVWRKNHYYCCCSRRCPLHVQHRRHVFFFNTDLLPFLCTTVVVVDPRCHDNCLRTSVYLICTVSCSRARNTLLLERTGTTQNRVEDTPHLSGGCMDKNRGWGYSRVPRPPMPDNRFMSCLSDILPRQMLPHTRSTAGKRPASEV